LSMKVLAAASSIQDRPTMTDDLEPAMTCF
jgi:hypothetical protein